MLIDNYNSILTLDSMEQCNKECISDYINSHISDVLDGGIYRSYRTGKLEITITVVFQDYIVADYVISDGCSDEFYIQSLGYKKAIHC